MRNEALFPCVASGCTRRTRQREGSDLDQLAAVRDSSDFRMRAHPLTSFGASMPSVKKRTKRLSLLVSQDELSAIEEYRFRVRMPNRAAAVRKLIKRGME